MNGQEATGMHDVLHQNAVGLRYEAEALSAALGGARRKPRRTANPSVSKPVKADPIPAAIRAELDQTPAWWQSQYDALVRKHFKEEQS